MELANLARRLFSFGGDAGPRAARTAGWSNYGNRGEREKERVRASISGEPWGGNEMRKVGGRGRVEENDREGV